MDRRVESVAAMSEVHVDLVALVKADLEARGVSLVGPCGAFAITSRVAWQLRDEGFGLVGKNAGQNGCNANGDRYAIDAVMLHDGQTFDILVSGGGDEDEHGLPIPGTGNGPAWQVTGAAPIASWRAPFNPDAGFVADLPPRPIEDEAQGPGTGHPLLQPPSDLAAAVIAQTLDIRSLRSELRAWAGDVEALRGELLGYLACLNRLVARLEQHGVAGRIGEGRFSTPITLKLPPA
jgi:hypothetical protein